jgi:hypothetical protein
VGFGYYTVLLGFPAAQETQASARCAPDAKEIGKQEKIYQLKLMLVDSDQVIACKYHIEKDLKYN